MALGCRLCTMLRLYLRYPRPCAAFTDPKWRVAMMDANAALLQNNTWNLVPRPSRVNVVSGKWIFKHKFKVDGSLERYKARWVFCSFT